jgi:putative DNA primase/helicase
MNSIPKSVPSYLPAALEYAEAGRVVFPVASNKRPLVKWGSLCPGESHVRQVQTWWDHWPRANIGLRTGDGLVVIDVDPRHGGEVNPSWPATRASQTRGGGVHLLYRSDRPVRCSASEVAPGVDIRGERGYIVVPPSPGWVWLNDLPLAELPELPGLDRSVSPCRGELDAKWRPFEIREVVSEGGRNAYLAALAGWLLSQGLDEMDMEQMLQDYNAGACRPVLDPDEVTRIASSIARYHR